MLKGRVLTFETIIEKIEIINTKKLVFKLNLI
jgi:hypothetical protein